MHLAGIFDAQLTKLVLSLHAYFRGLSDELVSKSSFNAVLCMTAGVQTSSLEKYLRVPLYYSTVFSDDRKRRLLTVDILSGWLLPLAEKSWMFTIRKPKAEKILTGKAKPLARIIFFPIPLSILSSVFFFFVATFPNAMAKTDDHTAPPSPKTLLLCFS